MEKHYPFQAVEAEMRLKWDAQFSCDPTSAGKPYTIMMPPPNVTGSLHIGHALSSTLQDILIRWKRMEGYDVLWLPGTDHAGIATQMMVEKQLATQGITRQHLGRTAFLKKVWEWKEHHGDLIIEQMKRLGFSADWDQLAFTMDPEISQSVVEAFVHLYRKGLIYRALRLINWDPTLQTALSDLEITNVTEPGTLWTLQYLLETPVEGKTHIEVATTRPETLFGDMAIAVHPDDDRYKNLVGTRAQIPLVHRWIPIIADEAVEIEKGTGAVKITPAHDFLDFEIASRHAISSLDILDVCGCLNAEVPKEFQGLQRLEAREAVLQALGETVTHTESIIHTVPTSQRSGALIEPRLTYQWFVDTTQMAAQAKKAVQDGQTRILPEGGETHYFQWLDHIQPWCISRQLWWGHQIPVWFGPNDSLFVACSEEEAYGEARQQFGPDVQLVQDEDVLDTWFSSGLWPFSTLGWPKSTPFLQRYYPTDVLVTGNDILFFWVARMMMLGLELTGQVPFRTVYLHPLVRDEKGQKMSKTKGNVVNPLDVIEHYGADALRFSLALAATPSLHISFGLKQVEQARNFVTKLWNVARLMSLLGASFPENSSITPTPTWIFNVWIVGEIQGLQEKITHLLQAYRFHEASEVLYHFVWDTFCDWYVEFAKDEMRFSQNDALKQEIKCILGWAFQRLLILLHPFVPFLTEKVWATLRGEMGGMLCRTNWSLIPGKANADVRTQSFARIPELMELVGAVRRLRAEFKLSPTVPLSLELYGAMLDTQNFLTAHSARLMRLLQGEKLQVRMEPFSDALCPDGAARIPLSASMTLVIPIAHLVDLTLERQRLQKVLDKEQKAYEILNQNLSNPDFLTRAPRDVVAKLQERLGEQEATLAQLHAALIRLTP